MRMPGGLGRRAWTGLALALLAAAPVNSRAEGERIFGFIIDKQEKKAPQRWSLGEWMATREKMRMMDMWLALHSPSPYEFFLAPSLRLTPSAGSPEQMNFDFQAGAYASVSGIEVVRRFAPEPEWEALLGLRFFGYHVQGTHLSLKGGLRVREGLPAPRNAFAGVEGAIYVTRFFGLEGQVRHEFARAGASDETAGLRWDGNAFIDFGYLRVFGGFTRDVGGAESWNVGTKLFF